MGAKKKIVVALAIILLLVLIIQPFLYRQIPPQLKQPKAASTLACTNETDVINETWPAQSNSWPSQWQTSVDNGGQVYSNNNTGVLYAQAAKGSFASASLKGVSYNSIDICFTLDQLVGGGGSDLNLTLFTGSSVPIVLSLGNWFDNKIFIGGNQGPGENTGGYVSENIQGPWNVIVRVVQNAGATDIYMRRWPVGTREPLFWQREIWQNNTPGLYNERGGISFSTNGSKGQAANWSISNLSIAIPPAQAPVVVTKIPNANGPNPVFATATYHLPYDGSEDLSQALTHILSNLPSGSTFYFQPNGTYDIEGPLVIGNANNITINGEGATFIRYTRGGLAPQSVTGVPFIYLSPNGGSAVCNRITLENFSVVGNDIPRAQLYQQQNNIGVSVQSCTNILLKNVYVQDVGGYGIEGGVSQAAVRNFSIYNASVNGTGWVAITFDQGADFKLENAILRNNGQGGIDIEPEEGPNSVHNVTIINLTGTNLQNFFFCSSCGAGTHSGTYIIDNTHLSNTEPEYIETSGPADYIIQNNTFGPGTQYGGLVFFVDGQYIQFRNNSLNFSGAGVPDRPSFGITSGANISDNKLHGTFTPGSGSGLPGVRLNIKTQNTIVFLDNNITGGGQQNWAIFDSDYYETSETVNTTLTYANPFSFILENANTTFNIFHATKNEAKMNFNVQNVTTSYTQPPGTSKLAVLSFNIKDPSGVSITDNVTYAYPCGTTSLAPYLLSGSTWVPLQPYTINAAHCVIIFTLTPLTGVLGFFAGGTVTQPEPPVLDIPQNPIKYGTTQLLTATAYQSTDEVEILINGAVVAGPKTGTVTYMLPVEASKNHPYLVNASDLTDKLNTSIKLNINPASSGLGFVNFPLNGTYTGNPFAVTANLVTVNNQLHATMTVNGVLYSTFTTQSTDPIANVGTYAIVASTPGNQNYSASTASGTLQIFARGQNGPPNLVVPLYNLNYSQSEVITATAIPSSDQVEIKESGTLVAGPTTGSTSWTLNTLLHRIGVGGLSVAAIDVNTGQNTTARLHVHPATPLITMPNFPNSGYYTGKPFVVTVDISTANNQVPVSVYVNGVEQGSSNTQYIYQATSPGFYSVVANTMGNDNYTKSSIVQSFEILSQGQLLPPTLTVPQNPIPYGNTEQITANAVPSTDHVEILVNNVVVTTPQVGTVTYNSPITAAGSYTINAFDITNKTSTVQTLVVSKLPANLSLPNFPSNSVYTGKPISVTANVISVNNQLTANLFINNIKANSFTSQLVVSVVDAGNYVFVVNTLGNENYTAGSVSNTLKVSPPAILHAPTLNIPINSVVYGSTETINAISNPSGDGIEILVNGVVKASKASGSLSYSFPVSAAGSYTINAFDTTNKTSTIGTLVVNKATPELSLPNFPENALSGKSFTITANMLTLNNQLSGNLFINNVRYSSFNTMVTAIEVDAGTYVVVANTLGNGNYVAASVTNTLHIGVGTTPLPPTLTILNNPLTYGSSESINAIANPKTDTVEILVNGVKVTSANSGVVTYIFPISTAGSYTINAFDTTNKTSTLETLIVNKTTPQLALPNFPINTVYTGNPRIITATMSSLNNQLTGNLAVNGINVGSFRTQTTTSEVNIGTYVVVASTLGDMNYTEASVTNTLQIRSGVSNSTSTTSTTSSTTVATSIPTTTVTTTNSTIPIPSIVLVNENSTSCYEILNVTQDNSETLNLNGTAFSVSEGEISPHSAIVTVNSNTYTLYVGAAMELMNDIEGYNYSIEVDGISPRSKYYIENLSLCSIKMNGSPTVISNYTPFVNITTRSGQALLLLQNGSTTLVNYDNSSVVINITPTQNMSVLLSLSNITNTNPHQPPRGESALEVFLIGSNSSSILPYTITARYQCSYGNSVAPYLLYNTVWQKVNNFTLNSSTCTVTFDSAGNLTIGIFRQLAVNTTTTVSPIISPSAIQDTALVELAIGVVIVILGIIIGRYEKKHGRFSNPFYKNNSKPNGEATKIEDVEVKETDKTEEVKIEEMQKTTEEPKENKPDAPPQ